MKKLKMLNAISFALIGGGCALASVPLALTSCKGKGGGGDNDRVFGSLTASNYKDFRRGGDFIDFNIKLNKNVETCYLSMDEGDMLEDGDLVEIDGSPIDETNCSWFYLWNDNQAHQKEKDFQIKLMKDSPYDNLEWHIFVNVIEHTGDDSIQIDRTTISFLSSSYLISKEEIENLTFNLIDETNNTLITKDNLKTKLTSTFGNGKFPDDTLNLTAISSKKEVFESLKKIDNAVSFTSLIIAENWQLLNKKSQKNKEQKPSYDVIINKVVATNSSSSGNDERKFDFIFLQGYKTNGDWITNATRPENNEAWWIDKSANHLDPYYNGLDFAEYGGEEKNFSFVSDSKVILMCEFCYKYLNWLYSDTGNPTNDWDALAIGSPDNGTPWCIKNSGRSANLYDISFDILKIIYPNVTFPNL